MRTMLGALGRTLVLGGIVAATAASSSGCQKDDEPVGPGAPVKVMTRNLYLGTDLAPLATVGSPAAIPGVAATLWGDVQASDFPARAKLLADEIVGFGPDLVALQEVTLYRRQVPGDVATGNVTPDATEVVIDFLALLTAEIDARGGGYHVAGEATNADAELPVDDGAGGTFDLRVTDRDVILARDGVDTSGFVAMPFASKFSLPIGGAGGLPISFVRSSSHLNATVGVAQFTFANAHLEIGALEPIQVLQATEMVSDLLGVPGPVLLLGDFNSKPGMTSYELITAADFNDAHVEAKNSDPGVTCCQAADLMNAESTAADRIDLVMARGRFRVNEVHVTGSDPATGRTPGGLWASDHFGTAATVELVP